MVNYKKLGWITGVFLLVSLAGCAESPDKDIVTNKNEGRMEAAIQEEKQEDKQEERSVPEVYTDNFQVDDGGVQITVEAELHPVDKPLPVVRVKPHTITGKEAEQWTNVLFEGKTAYEPERMTKAEIEKQILELKERLNNPDLLIQEQGSEEAADAAADIIEEEIKAYEAQYVDAPEQPENKECEWVFHPYGYYDTMPLPAEGEENYEGLEKTQQIIAVNDSLNNHKGRITVTNRQEPDYRLNTFFFGYEDEEKLTDIPVKVMSLEETVEIADELLDQMGLADWKYNTHAEFLNEEKTLYQLYYTPSYYGVDTFITEQTDLKSEDLYAANYYYSSLVLRIESGFVKSLEMLSPMDIVNTENENVETLPFEEVYQSFVTHMNAQFTKSMILEATDPNIDTAKLEVKISEVNQGLFRIKEKNNEDEFLMVPVWAFHGESYVNDSLWDEKDFVLVNALDGSIINPALGY